jgi:hypothetical protein
MLGGAVLNPDSAIPRQSSVCGGAIRFSGQRAIEAALPIDLSERLLLSRRALKPAAPSGQAARAGPAVHPLSRSANDATHYFQIPTGPVVEGERGLRSRGVNPAKVPPKLSQVSNSLIVSRGKQNIGLHSHPGLDQSVGRRRVEEYPAGLPRAGRECLQHIVWDRVRRRG